MEKFLNLILSARKNISAFPFRSISFNAYLCGLLVLITTGNSGCGDDDDKPSVFVTSEATQVTFTEINKCALGGNFYTEFFFAIPYEASPNQEIENVVYSIKATGSSGTPAEIEDNSFEDTGTEIKFSLCIQFGGASSIDFKYTLVSGDNIKSAPRTTIINRPAGAN